MKTLIYLALLFSLALLSLFVGVTDLSLANIGDLTPHQLLVLFSTRMPRTISLMIAGAVMAISGLVMQHLMQNKFVSPSIAGTIDSARLGIVIVMIGLPSSGILLRASVAFLFAFLGTLCFLLICHFLAKRESIMVPLIGVMFGNIMGSVATFFAYQYQIIQSMTSWLQGNFSLVMRGSYELLYITCPLFILVYLLAYRFTIIGMGEDMAKNLGLDYHKIQVIGIAIVAIASSLVLVTVGSIPFLGVVVPNIVSLRYGDQMKDTLKITAFMGSICLLVCDLIGRVVIFPYEIPVSVVMSVLGSLIFLWLLLRELRGRVA
jgi:iron complex transport system permease protein